MSKFKVGDHINGCWFSYGEASGVVERLGDGTLAIFTDDEGVLAVKDADSIELFKAPKR